MGHVGRRQMFKLVAEAAGNFLKVVRGGRENPQRGIHCNRICRVEFILRVRIHFGDYEAVLPFPQGLRLQNDCIVGISSPCQPIEIRWNPLVRHLSVLAVGIHRFASRFSDFRDQVCALSVYPAFDGGRE